MVEFDIDYIDEHDVKEAQGNLSYNQTMHRWKDMIERAAATIWGKWWRNYGSEGTLLKGQQETIW
jgi:hypothetical protein